MFELNFQGTIDVGAMCMTSAQFTELAFKLGFKLMYQRYLCNSEVRETQCWPEEGGKSVNEDQDKFFLFCSICCCEQNKYFSQLILVANQTNPSEVVGWKESFQVGLIPF